MTVNASLCVYYCLVFFRPFHRSPPWSGKRFKAGNRGRMDDLHSKRCDTRYTNVGSLSGSVENIDSGKLCV